MQRRSPAAAPCCGARSEAAERVFDHPHRWRRDVQSDDRGINGDGPALAGDGDLLLFEPTFRHGGVLVRADLLFRKGGRYRLVEVKASTGIEEHHYQDAAIQAWVIDGAGYPIDAVSIAHVDNSFIYPGHGDYRGLLKFVDVTQDIEPLRPTVPELMLRCQQILSGLLPEIPVGRQCGEPYECPFLGWCDRDAPEYPLSILGRHWRFRDELAARGYRDLRDVPEAAIGDGLPYRIWNATRSGSVFLNPKAADELRDLDYPRYYLDFETIQFAVPIWVGTRPYEQLPFQWSCHIEHADGRLEHREFLDTVGDAPMRACMEALIGALGTDGPVSMYTGFERRVLREAAVRYPDLAPALDGVIGRLVDLCTVTTQHYYHPAQKGSWSLKSVLRTIAPDLDYANLTEVADGGAAQLAYLEMVDPQAPQERKDALERALRIYCRRDTEGMVRITRRLAMNGPT
ncbi:MAG: DUF2779 domain-containing protein [Casimicrobiaceae bacterium]